MSSVFFYKEFNDHDLGNGESFLRKKFNAIIKDLEENKLTHQGSIKLISSKGGIKYLRAKLSDSDRLLFTSIGHNGKDVFVILEVIPNHDYENSRFLKSTDKTKSIEIKETEEAIEKSSDIVEIKDLERAHWLGKLVTFSATQEDIVKDVENYKLPLVISGAAGSGKTSVALESLRRIKDKFDGGKILYITKSKNLINESKKLFEYEYYDETAGEFKIDAPEEIEFLSLHEFLEKQAGDVKEKKPIDRSKFFSWFNKKCEEGKFKKYKKDGDKIFEEFTAVIGGGGLLGEEGKNQYVNLGKRQSIFPKNKRHSVYDFFEEYKKFIEGSSEYYDTSLIAYECVKEVQKVYDAVVVDEVQDLTESTLSLVLRSLKDESKGNFLLCGDVNQVIHPSFFSLSKLKSFLCQNKYIGAQGSEIFYTLEKSYRNSEQVTEVGNRILHLKNYCFASEDKMAVDNAFFMKSNTKNKGNVSFITDDKKEGIAGKVPGSINWAVLVLGEESKEDARKLFSTPLVFNIHEAKGLEFENVILYKFTSNRAYNEIWNIVCPGKSKKEIDSTINQVRDSYNEKNVKTSRNKDKEDKSFEECKFYINALYVGITRAIDNVYVIDDEKKCNLLKIIEPKEKGNVNIKKEESSPEEWRDMALKLIDEGNIEQAKDIAATKLSDKGEQKYAEEIINALKAQGYNKEVEEIELQFSLYKGKSDSELKIDTENPSYQFPEGCLGGNTESKVSTRKATEDNKKILNQKYGGRSKNNRGKGVSDSIKQFEQKEKLPELKVDRKLGKIISKAQQKHYSKEKMLAYAVQNGNFKMAEYFIGKGADVNARTCDGTSLHIAAQNGRCDLVKLLLKNGADVNAKGIHDYTPLHVAVQNGHYDVVKLLLNNKADVNAKMTKIGMENATSLHIAAMKGHAGIVKLLLDYEADVNAKGHDCTPLHVAVRNGHYDVVKLLLDYGADVNANAKSNHSKVPLALALEQSHSEVVDPLLADPNINVGCIKIGLLKNVKSREKFLQKLDQDNKLFKKVEEAAREVDGNKVDELLREIKKLLESKSECGFKPSLNYSPEGNDENTTIKIAIKARGELLQLLYDYAEKNIGTDTEIFKQLKRAKEHEKTQPKSDVSNVSVSGNLAQAQALIT